LPGSAGGARAVADGRIALGADGGFRLETPVAG